ncbi:hypothetical protein R69619_00393 [Paraburkholderia nemoris]|uniref:BrnA antitoxin family protein n=1 Tax=Paraburkholderia nemoris TaxID=2793076 RepID=UPI00190AC0F0|nr:BrnA antitoxin family protein [Paraburkholderia nemoris]MBK3737658.1 BrnA antitoxin family protein [Paraburkholderia aspalathi]CAE6694132.1 hypothetical protein R69619_00393 [Paraburkholderia nemoris]
MSETIKTKSGRTIILPTLEEDAEINRGIAADPDTYELSNAEFKTLRPFSEVVAERQSQRKGQTPQESDQEEVVIAYDADVLEAFRATGEGWQARMNDALHIYLKEHPIKPA